MYIHPDQEWLPFGVAVARPVAGSIKVTVVFVVVCPDYHPTVDHW